MQWLEGGAAGDGRPEWNAALVASMKKRAEELASGEEQLCELPALKAENARLAALVRSPSCVSDLLTCLFYVRHSLA